MKAALMYLAIFIFLYLVAVFSFRKKELYVELPFSREYSLVGKGFAIAIVVYGHLGNLFNIRYLTPLGGIGVAMFLILSGYGINESWKKNGRQDYWKKRLIAVFLPYIFVEAAAIPIRGGYTTATQAILDLLAIRSDYYLGWYITFQIVWYVLYYFVMRYISSPKIRYSIWIATGTIIILFSRMLYARQAYSFILGVALSDYQSLFSKLKRKRTVLIITLTGVILLGIKQIPLFRATPEVIQNSLDMLMAVSFSVAALFFLVLVDKRFLTPFYYLGIVSFEIYLIHGYTLWIVNLSFINALFFIGLTIGASVTIHFVLKKIQAFLTGYLIQKGF